MPRGGKRQGTPGKGYSNRTDLTSDYSAGSPASGGMVTGPTAAPAGPATPPGPPPTTPQPTSYPEDSPMLSDPTNRPDEPITAGLPTGPGPGPADATAGDWTALKAKLPDLKAAAEWPDTPVIFKYLVSYLENK
jgi:hypothetical protein